MRKYEVTNSYRVTKMYLWRSPAQRHKTHRRESGAQSSVSSSLVKRNVIAGMDKYYCLSLIELMGTNGPMRIPEAAKRVKKRIKMYTILLIKTDKTLEGTHMLHSTLE